MTDKSTPVDASQTTEESKKRKEPDVPEQHVELQSRRKRKKTTESPVSSQAPVAVDTGTAATATINAPAVNDKVHTPDSPVNFDENVETGGGLDSVSVDQYDSMPMFENKEIPKLLKELNVTCEVRGNSILVGGLQKLQFSLGPHLRRMENGIPMFPGVMKDEMNVGWLIPVANLHELEPVLYGSLRRMIRHRDAPKQKDYEDRIKKLREMRQQYRQFSTVKGTTHVLVAEFLKKTNVGLVGLVEFHNAEKQKILSLARQHLGNQVPIRAMPKEKYQEFIECDHSYQTSFNEDNSKLTPQQRGVILANREANARQMDDITDETFA